MTPAALTYPYPRAERPKGDRPLKPPVGQEEPPLPAWRVLLGHFMAIGGFAALALGLLNLLGFAATMDTASFPAIYIVGIVPAGLGICGLLTGIGTAHRFFALRAPRWLTRPIPLLLVALCMPALGFSTWLFT